MAYEVEIARVAAKALATFPEADARRLREKIADLARDPRPNGSRKLTGAEYGYRIRSGDYRAKYTIDDASKRVLVYAIEQSGSVYR